MLHFHFLRSFGIVNLQLLLDVTSSINDLLAVTRFREYHTLPCRGATNPNVLICSIQVGTFGQVTELLIMLFSCYLAMHLLFLSSDRNRAPFTSPEFAEMRKKMALASC